MGSARGVNPYLNRKTIDDPGDFFGRDTELRELFAIVGAATPQCVSVVGERRTGKSSLLVHAARREGQRDRLADPARYVFVYVDLLEVQGQDETCFWCTLNEALAKAAGVQCETPAGEAPGADGSVTACYREFVDCVVRVIDGLKDAENREQRREPAVVLLLDEFESVVSNEHMGQDCLGRLRALTNGYRVSLVTSTRRSLADACHTDELRTSPFFNVFGVPIVVGALDIDGLTELVIDVSRRAGCPLEPDWQFVRHLSGDLPILVQYACKASFELRQQIGLTRGESLSDERRDALEEIIYQDALPLLEDVWEHLTPDAKEALTCAARRRTPAQRLQAVTKGLMSRDLLREDGKVGSELLRRFVVERATVTPKWDAWRWLSAALIVLGSAALVYGVAHADRHVTAVAAQWLGITADIIGIGLFLWTQTRGGGASAATSPGN